MRVTGFFRKINSKVHRLVSKQQLGMVVFVVSAPTAQQLKYAREHLRYWPYVKAFRPIDETHMKVLIFVGRGIPATMWNYYVTRSCELMNRCVRQYNALFSTVDVTDEYSLYKYHPNAFLRPDDLLKPFCDFIDEIYLSEQSSISIHLNS